MPSSHRFKNITVTWLHHASFLVDVQGITIYIDPFEVKTSEHFMTVPEADLILLTHDHFDHTDQKSIERIQKKETVIISAHSFETTGQVSLMKSGEDVEHYGFRIKAVPAYNLGKPFHPKEAGNVGFIIESQEGTIYHVGDSDLIPEMRDLDAIDVLLLPIGGTYTMNTEEGIQAVAQIKPKIVIPMHYNYIEGTEVSENSLTEFQRNAQEFCENVVILDPAIPPPEK